MCKMAEKSPDAPSVAWRCGYGAHGSREAGIDLRECQMTGKNYRPLIRNKQQISGIELITQTLSSALVSSPG
jgi:hypothetical protein